MSHVNLAVNGEAVSADIEPRLHLADFLREYRLLTGTHLGCEHGVCGACTILIDGAPARSCITLAASCEGADVRTIEGLQDDPVAQRLRAAFTAEHALQCGYCTPGMLVTARDIVLRLPEADETRIRLELAGNLCRCTGYAGIVRAVRRVLNEGVPVAAPAALPLPALESVEPIPLAAVAAPGPALHGSGPSIALTIRIARPLAEVWAALHDPALLAECVPGARLGSVADGNVSGEMHIALGPIAATFAGTGLLALDEAAHTATLAGEASDARSRTRLSGNARIVLAPDGPAGTSADVAVAYALRGPLAQLARASIVQAVAGEIAAAVARNLERRLDGEMAAPVRRPSPLGLLMRLAWAWVRRLSRAGRQ